MVGSNDHFFSDDETTAAERSGVAGQPGAHVRGKTRCLGVNSRPDLRGVTGLAPRRQGVGWRDALPGAVSRPWVGTRSRAAQDVDKKED